jgi:DNA polymerase
VTAPPAALADAISRCTACPELVAARTTVVVGDVVDGAQVLLVGEAPGAQEDLVGRPFVGKAGQLLDRLLGDAGLDRSRVAVVNVLKCRPPANRTPSAAEVARCRPWLEQQLEVLNPPLVVTLGSTAMRWACGPRQRLGDLRGLVHEWRDRRLVVTYHPSAALRFGPNGAPMAALRADLRLAAATAALL